MKIEKIITKRTKQCINIAGNCVDSLRINNDTENTVRVYDNGCIGVAGQLGNVDMSVLEREAIANLSNGIPYPADSSGKCANITVNTAKELVTADKLVGTVQQLVGRLSQENSQFIFSNKVIINSVDKHYSNGEGANYHYVGNRMDIAICVKHKDSSNIMDEFVGGSDSYYNEDEICADANAKLTAYNNLLPQIQEDEAIVIMEEDIASFMLRHFVADIYCNGASLFDGKLGQQLFSDKFSLAIDQHPDRAITTPFFDDEGVINCQYINYLVDKGVMTNLLTTKKTAQQYNVNNIGSAGAHYTGVPSISSMGLDVVETHKDLQQIIGNNKAVYLSITSGGDMTSDGVISMPIMVPYLIENGELVGRLPELTVTSSIFDLLGDNYMGATSKGLFQYGRQKHIVAKAKLVNKA